MIMDIGAKRMKRKEKVFWQLVDQCLGSFRAEERLIVMGNLNVKIGYIVKDRVTGVYGMPGVSENGEYLIDVYEGKSLH